MRTLATLIAVAVCLTTLFAQDNPLQPKGFRLPGGKEYKLPAPDPALKDDDKIQIKSAKKVRYAKPRIFLEEGVEFQFKGFNVKADRAEGDTESEQFTLIGNVTVRGADQVTTGDEVWVDFKNKLYRFTDGAADFQPKFFQGTLLTDLYVTGERSEGTNREATLFGASATTCPQDHFGLHAKQIDVSPERSVIFRRLHVDLLGKRLFDLAHFILPLNRKSYDGYVPDIGRSELEGMYVKSKFEVGLGHAQSFTTRFDAMEKRGFGTGIDRFWRHGKSSGALSVYNLYDRAQGQNSFIGTLRHTQQFGQLSFSGSFDARQNSYQTFSDSRSYGTNLDFRYNSGRNSSLLSVRNWRNSMNTFGSETTTANLSDQRELGGGFSLSNNLTYTDSSSTNNGLSVSKHEEVDVNVGVRYSGRKFDGNLAYSRFIPVGDTDNFFPGSEQTPVVTLGSDTRRLLGWKRIPTVFLETGYGQFLDNFSNSRVSRERFGARTMQGTRGGQGLSFGYTSEFVQSVYSDDTAQYILSDTLEARYGLAAKEYGSALILRYRYMRPYGFTPLSLDRRGEENNLTTMWEIPFWKSYTLRVGGGYDFLRERRGQQAWNTVGVALQYQPAKWLRAISTSTYDPNSHVWQNSRIRLDWKPGATTVMMEARYDAERSVWGNLNLRVEGFQWGRLKTSVLMLYNGYTRQFETQQYNLIYDLHCAEAILSYVNTPFGYRRSNDLQFTIRLKAFPYRSNFGLGVSGQPLDTSTGVDF